MGLMDMGKQAAAMMKNRKQLKEIADKLTAEPCTGVDPANRIRVTMDLKRNRIEEIDLLIQADQPAGELKTEQLLKAVKLATNAALAEATRRMADIQRELGSLM